MVVTLEAAREIIAYARAGAAKVDFNRWRWLFSRAAAMWSVLSATLDLRMRGSRSQTARRMVGRRSGHAPL